MEAVNTLPTGVDGLDEILKGGLPANRLYLVKGEPGVGKTTLAIQFLLEGVRRGERSMYITLSETKAEIDDVARSHGWDLANIHILEFSAFEQRLHEEAENTIFHPAELELNKTTRLFLDHVEKINPARLVIDSLSEFRLLSDTPLRYRREILALKQFFGGRKITVLLLDDHAGEGGDQHVQSIAHGVLTISQVASDYGTEKRRFKINKLRGVNFSAGYHDAAIMPGGLRIYPRLIAADHHHDFASAQVESGLAELDALLGGGFDRGTSSLLLGPAGCGKSSIALQYAVAAASRGEEAHIFLFEENVRTLKARARSIGIDVEGVLASGKLKLTQINPAQMSPGQFADLIKVHVKAGCRLVVIDSLNGYLYAMPNVQYLTIQLHELLTYLSHEGVVTIMTVAQHGIVGHMQSPVDITYLADTVVLLRFFEHAGHVKKAVSVVKKRIGYHEETIREFRIDSDGLRVGEPLEQFRGILTGVPELAGPAPGMLADRHD
jgi:circadian clock protein KaiC